MCDLLLRVIQLQEEERNWYFEYASDVGDYELVKQLKRHIRDQGTIDTALIEAAENGHVDIVELLLRDASQIAKTAVLRLAIINNHFEVAERLLDEGADIHDDNDELLRLSISNWDRNAIEFLLNNRADVHLKNDLLLRTALEKNDWDVVNMALEYGADRSKMNEFQEERYSQYLEEKLRQEGELLQNVELGERLSVYPTMYDITQAFGNI